MPRTAKKPTLKNLNTALVNKPKAIREAVLQAVGATTDRTFFDILNGDRKLNDAEKKEIATIYETTVEAIDWQDK